MGGLGVKADNGSFEQLFTDLYRELRSLAHARLRRHGAPTLLDTTSLVHESYLRFLRTGHVQIADQTHFIAYAARVMRSVIVDFAREGAAQRRGGGEKDVTLDTGAAAELAGNEREIIRLNDALDELSTVSERLVRVVEMRYYGGLTDSEIAEVLNVSERTVRRDWEKAKMILAAALA